jgi:hypothetical protein
MKCKDSNAHTACTMIHTKKTMKSPDYGSPDYDDLIVFGVVDDALFYEYVT